MSEKQLAFTVLSLTVTALLVISLITLKSSNLSPTVNQQGVIFFQPTGNSLKTVTSSPDYWHHGHWNSSCWLPPSGYKAWGAGVVTTLLPKVERNCTKLFAGDEPETRRVKEDLETWEDETSEEDLLYKMRDCMWLQEYFTENLYVTKLEKSFPIAYNFLVHNSAQQVLRLLRFLYKPHNAYCLHPDSKSSEVYKSIVRTLTLCFDNIIVPEELISVRWGHHSIMDAQMSCMKELLLWREKQPEHLKWRYVINLCGKELPIVTTHDIVAKLTKLNGSSSFPVSKVDKNAKISLARLRRKTIPFNLTYYKSATYGAISYKFAQFLHTNETAIKVYEFFRGCDMPEEHFYATLYMMPGIPGGYDPKLDDLYFTIDMYMWMYTKAQKAKCGGKVVHSICIVSVPDLPEILNRSKDGKLAIFSNKYFMEMDHVVMDCMEERLVARNRLEYKQDCPAS